MTPVNAPADQTESLDRADALWDAMGAVRVEQNPNIGVFLDMVRRISLAQQPQQVMQAFSNAMRQAFGDSALVTVTCRGLKPGQYKVTRQIDYDDVNRVPTDDPWRQRDHLPTVSGGLIGQLITEGKPTLLTRLDAPHDPVLGDWLAQFKSMMAIPAFIEGTAMNWAIVLRREPDAFSLTDLEEHLLRANLIGANVNNVVINQELRTLNDRMRREMERIGNIQRALLPKRLPRIAGLSVAASYETYDRAGGDMYDFVCLLGPGHRGEQRPDARWAMMVADVSGHGPSAAVVMAMLNAILGAYPKVPDGPAELLAYANRHLLAKRIEDSFVTAFMAIYDPPTRRFTFARAGHPPALLKSNDQPLVRLDGEGGLPLGILEDIEYRDTTIELQPGQTVVLYTDGITESMDPAENMFGIKGIERALDDCSGEPYCVVEAINTALRAHEGGQRPGDDQTIVAMQVHMG